METTFFASSADLRDWLSAHHDTAVDLWIGFYKKGSGHAGITYPEARDEALCFGWIDGIRKTIDDARYQIRFTPRKSGSIWSQVNIKRVEELIAQGLMQPSGLAAFEKRDPSRPAPYSFEVPNPHLDAAAEAEFQRHAAAWEFFQAQPPSYRRTASWWVMGAKREETRQKRLAILIADSEKGVRLAQITYDRERYRNSDGG
jgi:uncharacterized protein YdeI (YjbR/CyaY-like superfamily)